MALHLSIQWRPASFWISAIPSCKEMRRLPGNPVELSWAHQEMGMGLQSAIAGWCVMNGKGIRMARDLGCHEGPYGGNLVLLRQLPG
jgi:hypothetical protein